MDNLMRRAMQRKPIYGVKRSERPMTDTCEEYAPPKHVTIKALAAYYLCEGITSRCWECECCEHCGYGQRFMEMLRARVKAQKHGWRGYERAASPLIRAECLAGREAAAKDRDDQHQRVRKQESNQESKKGTRKNDD